MSQETSSRSLVSINETIFIRRKVSIFLDKILALDEILYSDGPVCISLCLTNYTGLEIRSFASEMAKIWRWKYG